MEKTELNFVKDAFNSNWIAPLGPNVEMFEKSLTNYLQVKNALALVSGTSAIHLALLLLNIKKKDIVLCQTLTFAATVNPVVYVGANPVLIDSEAETWNIDPNILRETIIEYRKKGKNPKAIIPVHLYGMPAKVNDILSISNEFEIPVIEDSAESLGSKFFNQFCGTFFDYGILSFNGNKIITTSGGGALLSNKNLDHARLLASQSRENKPYYEHLNIGYNYRLSNVLAGIGIGQLNELNNRIESRRKNFERYKDFFNQYNNKGFNIVFQEELFGHYSNRWLTCILINPEYNNGMSSEDIRLAFEKNNIESRPIWKPMHQQPIFKSNKRFLNGVSDYLFSNGLCLPSGSNLDINDFDRIFETLDIIFKKYRK